MIDREWTDSEFENLARLFRAFSEPVRLKILRELHDGPRSVSELHEVIGGSQANVSQHLSVLQQEQIVGRRREGTRRIYFIKNPHVKEICERVCGYFESRREASPSGGESSANNPQEESSKQ